MPDPTGFEVALNAEGAGGVVWNAALGGPARCETLIAGVDAEGGVDAA